MNGSVLFARFSTLEEALVAQSLLRSAGFDVSLNEYWLPTINWHYTQALGGIGLRAPVSELRELAEFIDEIGSFAPTFTDPSPLSRSTWDRGKALWSLLFSPSLGIGYPILGAVFFVISNGLPGATHWLDRYGAMIPLACAFIVFPAALVVWMTRAITQPPTEDWSQIS